MEAYWTCFHKVTVFYAQQGAQVLPFNLKSDKTNEIEVVLKTLDTFFANFTKLTLSWLHELVSPVTSSPMAFQKRNLGKVCSSAKRTRSRLLPVKIPTFLNATEYTSVRIEWPCCAPYIRPAVYHVHAHLYSKTSLVFEINGWHCSRTKLIYLQ